MALTLVAHGVEDQHQHGDNVRSHLDELLGAHINRDKGEELVEVIVDNIQTAEED